jgi:hypothetical protein
VARPGKTAHEAQLVDPLQQLNIVAQIPPQRD